MWVVIAGLWFGICALVMVVCTIVNRSSVARLERRLDDLQSVSDGHSTSLRQLVEFLLKHFEGEEKRLRADIAMKEKRSSEVKR